VSWGDPGRGRGRFDGRTGRDIPPLTLPQSFQKSGSELSEHPPPFLRNNFLSKVAQVNSDLRSPELSHAPQMIRFPAWRCTPRAQDLAKWFDAHASAQYLRPQHRTISKATAEHHAHMQDSRQPPKQDQNRMNTVVEEPAGQENGLPEPEFDWSLDATELSTAEQEARFARSRTGRVFTKVYTPCPVCDMRHQLSFCPFVFEDNPRHLSKPKDKTRGFEERMEKSKEFRDAVEYLRKTFTRRDLTLRHVAVPNYQTQDAPPPARGKNGCQTSPRYRA
jgi:hypothetical protein